jgi:hypothetical protein
MAGLQDICPMGVCVQHEHNRLGTHTGTRQRRLYARMTTTNNRHIKLIHQHRDKIYTNAT